MIGQKAGDKKQIATLAADSWQDNGVTETPQWPINANGEALLYHQTGSSKQSRTAQCPQALSLVSLEN